MGPSDSTSPVSKDFANLLPDESSNRDKQIEELQGQLEHERDARSEDRFFFICVCVILLDIVLFTTMPNFGGPLALLILQLIVLVPLARRMGMEEVATILGRVLDRMAGKGGDKL